MKYLRNTACLSFLPLALLATTANPGTYGSGISYWYTFIASVLLLIFVSAFYKNRKIYKAELKTAESENGVLHAELKQLQRENKFQRKMISIIAHDVRTPISSIVGIFNLYSENKVNDEELLYAKTELNSKLESLDILLENLLRWSARDHEKTNNKKIVSVHELITDDIKLYSNSPKNISIYNHIPADVKIYANANEVNVAIRNLLSNAIKFTNKDGRIDVSAEKAGKKTRLIIEDTGIGMTNDQLSKLFNKNGGTSKGTNGEKGSGLGLGLVLTKEFIENNNGTISVQSEVNTGTRFVLEFPLVTD